MEQGKSFKCPQSQSIAKTYRAWFKAGPRFGELYSCCCLNSSACLRQQHSRNLGLNFKPCPLHNHKTNQRDPCTMYIIGRWSSHSAIQPNRFFQSDDLLQQNPHPTSSSLSSPSRTKSQTHVKPDRRESGMHAIIHPFLELGEFLFSLLVLWGNKNWPPSMKVKEL